MVNSESKSAEADYPSAGPDGRQTPSGTAPPLRRLGSSTGPEETKTGGRRLDSELEGRRRNVKGAVAEFDKCLRTARVRALLHCGILTGGLEAFDVSGGLQEVATEVEEEEEEREHRDEDPGDH